MVRYEKRERRNITREEKHFLTRKEGERERERGKARGNKGERRERKLIRYTTV